MSLPRQMHGLRCRAAFAGATAGWSLTEFMVAIAVASLIAMIASTMIMAMKSAYVSQIETTQQEENGRFALEQNKRNKRQATNEHWGRDQAAIINRAEISPAIT